MNDPRPRARVSLRLVAAAVDYVLIGAGSAVVGVVAGGSWRMGGPAGVDEGEALLSDPVLAAAVGIMAAFGMVGALYMLLEVRFAATPGKRLLGLVVGREDGSPPSVGTGLARYLVKNGHLVVAALSAVSGMWIMGVVAPLVTLVVIAGSALMLTGDHRALHDIVARTAVFRAERRG